MNDLKFLIYNCRGLNDTKKRYDVLNFIKDQKADICCLQDTHFTKEMEQSIYTIWEGECFYSHGKSNSRGVCILIKKNLNIKVHCIKKDSNGSLLALDLSFENHRFTLVALYGPNIDSPEFYKHVFNVIDKIGNDSYILCGDYNLVLNSEIDYCNYKSTCHNINARKLLLTYIENRNLVDPFRILHGNIKRYTWRRLNPLQQARLDFFLMTDDMLQFLRNSDIYVSYKSDHSILDISLCFENVEHGKGLWKFNNSLLQDLDYLECINTKIEEIKKQYSVPIYNPEKLLEIDDNDLQFTISDQLFLETLLMEIRGKTISYASYRNKNKTKQEQILLDEIKKLEKNLTAENKETYVNLHDRLNTLRNEK